MRAGGVCVQFVIDTSRIIPDKKLCLSNQPMKSIHAYNGMRYFRDYNDQVAGDHQQITVVAYVIMAIGETDSIKKQYSKRYDASFQANDSLLLRKQVELFQVQCTKKGTTLCVYVYVCVC